MLAIFFVGLFIRVFGGLAIWAADGHDDLASKIIVILGVALSIIGIGVLKWLSMRRRTKLDEGADSVARLDR